MSEAGTDGQAAGAPGRYQRSTNGLIGAMLVLLLVVGAFVLFRGTFREEPDYVPPDVDYLSVVTEAGRAGLELVHPSALPEGWSATEVTLDPGDRPVWDLAMLTDEGTFVGLHEEDEDVDDLLAVYVDEAPGEGDPLQVEGSVATTWQSFSDEGGDHAYAAEVGDRTVLVYGSADVADLQLLLSLLTTGAP
ncbi:unannotated protein [freshwater metagenome]|uniref:Unannotated protein n=1 Tax=freshwater metagenome TaxID=449393 RepID=A0A6J6PM30_9ZZZZ